MIVRYLADEDVDAAIVNGLRIREPLIDILDVKAADLRGTPDPELLKFSAAQGRIVITHDTGTMVLHFKNYLVAGGCCLGLFLLPQRCHIGAVEESLYLVSAASDPTEWTNRIVYLPFR